MVDTRANFAGTIPEYYDSCLGPAWFGAFGADLARRLPASPPGDVLELACGTGLVTRELRAHLDPARRLVATDISQAMLDYARGKLADRAGIDWREADATRLPFDDGAFGAVVCAFGVMFVPDRRALFREARRVLKDGGILLFNVWDGVEGNTHAAIYAAVVEGLFPGDAEVRFRIPYEMNDAALLRQLVEDAGFAAERIESKRLPVGNVSARTIAQGQIRGTPRSLLIEKRGVALEDVIDRVTAELAKVGGADPYRGTAAAVVVEARVRGGPGRA
jgi:ubiquinone/menaquinone biosynthesis C-methylase UbiE